MNRLLLLLFILSGCESSSASIAPRACGGGCTTSSQCNAISSNCRSCFDGKCSSVLPADPVTDAGAQTSKGTAP
jgi:hypothetical protein